MFSDIRSKSVVFVAHCILNQNSLSDGTASYPSQIKEVLGLLTKFDVGIVQMPCPELLCLGLSRGNIGESLGSIVEENARIRKMMSTGSAVKEMKKLIKGVIKQIIEYRKYGFTIKGIVGINRSPSCGVETTSKDNKEANGRGVFIEALFDELSANKINLDFVGIKVFEMEEAVVKVEKLLHNK